MSDIVWGEASQRAGGWRRGQARRYDFAMTPSTMVRLAYLVIALLIASSSALTSVAHAFAHTREGAEQTNADGADHDHHPMSQNSARTGGISDHGHPRLDNAPVHVRVSLVLPIAVANVLHFDFNRVSDCPSLDADELPGFEATGPPPQVRAPPQV